MGNWGWTEGWGAGDKCVNPEAQLNRGQTTITVNLTEQSNTFRTDAWSGKAPTAAYVYKSRITVKTTSK